MRLSADVLSEANSAAGGTRKTVAISCRRPAPTRFLPFSYFLQLLERDAERVGERDLRHLSRQPLRADAGADGGVGGGRGFRPAASHHQNRSAE